MRETIITARVAARNCADCVNRAQYRNETFVLLRDGVPFAWLVPDAERICTGEQLPAAIAGNSRTPVEARAWAKDLKAARKALKAPVDPRQ